MTVSRPDFEEALRLLGIPVDDVTEVMIVGTTIAWKDRRAFSPTNYLQVSP